MLRSATFRGTGGGAAARAFADANRDRVVVRVEIVAPVDDGGAGDDDGDEELPYAGFEYVCFHDVESIGHLAADQFLCEVMWSTQPRRPFFVVGPFSDVVFDQSLRQAVNAVLSFVNKMIQDDENKLRSTDLRISRYPSGNNTTTCIIVVPVSLDGDADQERL